MSSLAVTTAPLRILLVEDRVLDAELVLAAVEHAGYAIASANRVETEADFLQELSRGPDVILCDYSLPSFSALAALRLMQERNLDIPFIIVSGSIGEETAVEAIKTGADDYLLKDRLGRLGSAIAHALEQKQLRDAADRAAEDLRQSEIKYRSLFEHLPEAAYLCDAAHGRIIDTNPRGETLLGLERAGVLGLRLSHFMPQPIVHTLLTLAGEPTETTLNLTSEIVGAHRRNIPASIRATLVVIARHRLMLVFVREVGAQA
jgi:PAS domain S-box-containing protein